MYIQKYWGNFIGGTDDSLTLLEYLKAQTKTEISLHDIFADTGLEKLNWDFRRTDPELSCLGPHGEEYTFYYAIDLVTDLAALLLECRMNQQVSIGALLDEPNPRQLRITAADEECAALVAALENFCSDPLAYDLSEMVPDDAMQELAKDCESLCRELAASAKP